MPSIFNVRSGSMDLSRSINLWVIVSQQASLEYLPKTMKRLSNKIFSHKLRNYVNFANRLEIQSATENL